jgi:hypothetical protein
MCLPKGTHSILQEEEKIRRLRLYRSPIHCPPPQQDKERPCAVLVSPRPCHITSCSSCMHERRSPHNGCHNHSGGGLSLPHFSPVDTQEKRALADLSPEPRSQVPQPHDVSHQKRVPFSPPSSSPLLQPERSVQESSPKDSQDDPGVG